MIIKKRKWLWSYNVKDTEDWLANMADEGLQLEGISPITRTFYFRQAKETTTTFRIQHKETQLSNTLKNAGWETAATKGKWTIVRNESDAISLYPARDSLLKRNRLHAYIALILAIFQLTFHLPIFIVSFFIMTIDLTRRDYFPLFLLIGIIMVFTSFAVFIFNKYRQFEKREMNIQIHTKNKKKKVRKFKSGWIYYPEQTTQWLEKMANEGYVLEKANPLFFTFIIKDPMCIKYEFLFEWKISPTFYTIHQELGWKLKFHSTTTILHYSLWAHTYESNKEKPRITYDINEQRKNRRRYLTFHSFLILYLFLLMAYSNYNSFVVMKNPLFEWNFNNCIRFFLLFVSIMWFYLFVKICYFTFKKRWKMLFHLK